MPRPFRFAAQVPDFPGSLDDWQRDLEWLADAGFSTVAIADHFTGGYTMEPLVTLAAAAARSTLRIQTAVLGLDYRDAVLVHRSAATLDLLSGGRLELGLGAGWMLSDYEAAAMTMDPPGRRIDRLEETIAVLKRLFSGEPVHFDGEHIRVHGLAGVPYPVQRPHPPLLVGGGGRRMLRLAGREANIAGINANLSAGKPGGESVIDVGWDSMLQKVGWVREGAEASGRPLESIELSMTQWLLHVSDSRTESDALISKMSNRLGVDEAWLEDAPGVLVGSTSRIKEKVQAMRERLGISYIQVHAGPRGTDLHAVGPVITALAGT